MLIENNWGLCHWSKSPTKNPTVLYFLRDNWNTIKLILKCVWNNKQTEIAKKMLERESKRRWKNLNLPDNKIHYKILLIKTCGTGNWIDNWYVRIHPEIDPNKYDCMHYNKNSITNCQEKMKSSNWMSL